MRMILEKQHKHFQNLLLFPTVYTILPTCQIETSPALCSQTLWAHIIGLDYMFSIPSLIRAPKKL